MNDPSTELAPNAADASARSEAATEPEAAAPADETRAAVPLSPDTPLLHPGNPLRWLRGLGVALAGGFAAFLLMAHTRQLSFGVPLGALCIAVATFGVLDFLGTFDDDAARVAKSQPLGALGRPIGVTVASIVAFGAALAGGAHGGQSQLFWGAVVTATFVVVVFAIYQLGAALGPWATDENGEARPVWRRHGFWLMVLGGALYLPMLGAFSLWDPWETHYGEVAREVLARDDWISLWWAQDGWFWSKPILNFWIQALAMATARVHFQPDAMLLTTAGANAHPEWIVRTPNVLLTLLGMYFLYKGVARVFGRRAGFLGGLVLATMPDWFFLAHQTMADMPFVAPMTAAMGLLLLGIYTDEEQRARLYEVTVGKLTLRLSGYHLVVGGILLCALPQVLYLLSRNIELILSGAGPYGFHAHWDEFRSGSAGNCSLPGNEACNAQIPAVIPRGAIVTDSVSKVFQRAFGGFEPFVQSLAWGSVLGFLLFLNWGERRVRRLYYLAAWLFAAIATMGKGPAGFGLPILCAFAYVATVRRWRELLRFEMLSGLLIILAVAIPWYVAMYVRHGAPFTDRLIFHDMFNRAFNHVHDTNEGDDTSFRFYIWQLGYAVFPWTGLVPAGLIYWARRSDAADEGRGDVSVFLVMWFVFAFGLFSFMGTKFHHYIFPAVPPAAMLVGTVLDDMLGKGKKPRSRLLYLVAMTVGVALAVAGLVRFFPGSISGERPVKDPLLFAFSALGLVIVVAGVALIAAAIRLFGATGGDGDAAASTEAGEATSEQREDEARSQRRHEALMLGGAALAGALLLVVIGRDLAVKPENADQPGAIRLLQLFTYNYRRAWPETLDFSAILAAFSVAAVVSMLLLVIRRIRRHAVVIVCALGVVWALWGLDVYMVKVSPHWGQHELIEAYYRDRAGPNEPLIAYQMNWKGENFYTGNRIPAFVSTGATFTSWVKKKKDAGQRVMYFITEPGRVNGLRGEVGGKAYREITTKALCNKFVVVRAEL